MASKLQCPASVSNQKEVLVNLRMLSKKPKKRTSSVRNKEGNFITDQHKKSERWKEYFEKLLNADVTLKELSPVKCNISFFGCLRLIPPDIEEIIRPLSKLKNHESPGFDGISD